jgi:hypothetical protein
VSLEGMSLEALLYYVLIGAVRIGKQPVQS